MLYLSSLLHAERQRRGTRAGTRALTCFKEAVLILRWFLDGTRMRQLADDNNISASTGYDYVNEGIDVLAVQAPSLHGVLPAATAAGYANACADLARRDHRTNSPRSSSLNISSALGRPIFCTPPYKPLSHGLPAQDTSLLSRKHYSGSRRA